MWVYLVPETCTSKAVVFHCAHQIKSSHSSPSPTFSSSPSPPSLPPPPVPPPPPLSLGRKSVLRNPLVFKAKHI